MTFIWSQTSVLILFFFIIHTTLAVPGFGRLDKHVNWDLIYVTLQLSVEVMLSNLSLWIPLWFPIKTRSRNYLQPVCALSYLLISRVRWRSKAESQQKQNQNQNQLLNQHIRCVDSVAALILGLPSSGRNEGGFTPLRTALQWSPEGEARQKQHWQVLALLIWREQRQRFLSWPCKAPTVKCPSWKATCAALPATKMSGKERKTMQGFSASLEQ